MSRTRELHAELAAIASPAPWWWLLAAGVAACDAMPQPRPLVYLACDAEPDADTLIAIRSPRPTDIVADAIARARAARTAIRELDGTLPDQPLAVTLDGQRAARLIPSSLEVAAFAIGNRVVNLHLDDPQLPLQLMRTLTGEEIPRAQARPFVCVSLGDEPLATARHGHRRAWGHHDDDGATPSTRIDGDGATRSTRRGGGGGPWLGLGRSGELAIVSTCHLVVDGYGHARLAARIEELVRAADGVRHHVSTCELVSAPVPRAIDGAIPLSIAWREIDGPLPRVIPLAYRLGCLLHRIAVADAARLSPTQAARGRFSPTIQIPVAQGAKDDPLRLHRRVVAATINVRFDARGEPEPLDEFEARVRDVFAREAAARGLVSRLLAAARVLPAPLAWKRKGITAKRPAWLEGFADVIGGRALLSRISVDTPIPLSYAVSSPSRLASANDPLGSCVLSLVDDGERGAITLSGSGQLGSKTLLDELLADSTRSNSAGKAAPG